MNIRENFRLLLEDVDISAVQREVFGSTEEDWKEESVRQDTFIEAEDTEAIILKFNGPTQGIYTPSSTRTFDHK